jgi:mRNA interferase MazF
VVKREYVPDAGDIVWLQGMALCCPMTTKIKGYVFEVVVSHRPPSAVLADQIRSFDWRARRARRKGAASPPVLAEVRARIKALLML